MKALGYKGKIMKVCIEVDDQGQFTVGTEGMPMKPGMGGMAVAAPEGPGDAGMKPAATVDEALQIARDLLTNPQAQAAKPDQNEMWNRVQRDRALASQPGGPMMGKMG